MQLFNKAEKRAASSLGSQKIKVNTKKIFGCQINGSYVEYDQSVLRFAICVHPDSGHFALALYMIFNSLLAVVDWLMLV